IPACAYGGQAPLRRRGLLNAWPPVRYITDLMSDFAGTHGLIVGGEKKRSIAWSIAKAVSGRGARLAVTYQGERLEENVRELSADLADPLILPLDVTSDEQIAAVAATCDATFGGLDFVVHGAAYAPREELTRS